MKQLIEKDLAALKDMTPRRFRERYAELYGEPSRNGNRGYRAQRTGGQEMGSSFGPTADRIRE